MKSLQILCSLIASYNNVRRNALCIIQRGISMYKCSISKQELASSLLSCSRHVANGMVYLEMKCFIHRDLAARNILVDHDGICKVC